MEYKIKVKSSLIMSILFFIIGGALWAVMTQSYFNQDIVSITTNGVSATRSMQLSDYLMFSLVPMIFVLVGVWSFIKTLKLKKAAESELPTFNYTIIGIERVVSHSKKRRTVNFYLDCTETNHNYVGHVTENVRFDITLFGSEVYTELASKLKSVESIPVRFSFLDEVKKNQLVKIFL